MRRIGLGMGLLLALAGAARAEVADYAGSAACTGCHAEAAAAWAGSHHALAWTSAAPENIRADFDGTGFTLGDMHVAFRIAPDGSRHAAVTELDGTTTDYQVQGVAGIAPLQQYLFETVPGRLQSFDVVWDTVKGGWFHLYPDQSLPPADGLHWTGPYKTWNGRCAVCHATGYSADYQPVARSYSSTEAEIGVGCEACHGPGQAHVDWLARAGTSQEPPPPHAGFLRDLSDPAAFLDTCGGCHSRREAYFDGTPPPGTAYHDAYNLSQLRPGLYWPDGQMRDEVYVLGSFLQSKMHAKGVTCTNCHEPHAATPRATGNAVCTQCHSPAGNPDFPSLPLRVFDGPEHTRHPDGSAGAECKSCHMPEQVYMGNDWRADHSFRIPRPDLSAETGAPDACTSCHTGRDPGWAAAVLKEWFPESTHRGPHFGQVLARAERDPAAASGDLAALARGGWPGIVRATALWLIGQGAAADAAEATASLLGDADPMVRAAAVEAQRGAPPMAQVERIVPLLGDPSRSVRIAAARALLGAPIARLPANTAAELRAAQGEWQATLGARLDFPETHLQLAGLALTLRNFPAAARAFAEVTALDPQQVDAWIMQARLAAALQGPEAAREVLDRAVAANPDVPQLAGLLAEIAPAAPPR